MFRNIPPTGARTTDLALRAGMKKQSMSYLIEDLTNLGYAEATPDPRDGRARLIRLAPRGIEASTALTRLSVERENRWSKRLGAKDWATTRRKSQYLVDLLEVRS